MTNYFNSRAFKDSCMSKEGVGEGIRWTYCVSLDYFLSVLLFFLRKFIPPSSSLFPLFFCIPFVPSSPSFRSFDYPKLETIGRGMFEAFFKNSTSLKKFWYSPLLFLPGTEIKRKLRQALTHHRVTRTPFLSWVGKKGGDPFFFWREIN